MYATLMDERGERELNTLSDKKARTMTGSVVASLAHLKDINGNDGAFFVFPDLSVRCEGVYRLKFSLFEIVGNQVFFCKSITSTMFTVYSAKKFPGMEESTRLTKLFAEQGLKIRVRKEQKSARPKGNRSRLIASTMNPDGTSPLQQPLMTWNIDHRQSMSGSGAYSGQHMQHHHQPHPHHQPPPQQSHQQMVHPQSQPQPQHSYPNTMANQKMSSASTANPLPSRPTPPSSWNNNAHMRQSSLSGRVALSQSPQPLQPHSISQYAPVSDTQQQQYSEADGGAGYAHNRHGRHQNHSQYYQQQQQQQKQGVLRTASPVVASHYRGHHAQQQQQQQPQKQQQPISGHPHPANIISSPNPANMTAKTIPTAVHTPGPPPSHSGNMMMHQSRAQTGSQTLPSINHQQTPSGGMVHGQQPLHQSDDRRKSYSRDIPGQSSNSGGGGGEYFDSPSYQSQNMAPPSHTYPMYRPMHVGEEGSGRSQSHHHHFGQQHRPWSPHHRAQQQQQPQQQPQHHHQSPTHSGVAFGSDSRYSPYNRQIDSTRDPRQHMSPGVRISALVSSVSNDAASPPYQDQQQLRNQTHIHSLPNLPNLRTQQPQPQPQQLSRPLNYSNSSSAPETPGSVATATNKLHLQSPQVHAAAAGHGRVQTHQSTYIAQQHQYRHASTKSPEATGTPTSANFGELSGRSAHPHHHQQHQQQQQHHLPSSSSAPALTRPGLTSAIIMSPTPGSVSNSASVSQMQQQPSQQHRIAVHSLLISDSSSPERANRSPS
ncbi:hypothetical protein H4R99_002968 [Coemansia sp. RSA 1722]|nr:hypothetical protein H4R99_002968 [Coemansia sp. RSA 1722]